MIAAVAAAGLVACGPPGRGRFQNRAPLWRVPEKPFSPPPPRRDIKDRSGTVDDEVFAEWERRLALEPHGVTSDVNSLDEVPDSSFFTNRIRDVTAQEVAHGGEDGEGMEVDDEIQVVDAKTAGATGGLVVKDARGNKFVVKFDLPGRYGLLSGCEAVTARLLWAAGYNVPDDRIVYIDPARLVPARNHEGPKPEEIAFAISRAARAPDGKIRALASKFVPGKVLGPMLWRGTRAGDPNDHIPHELRRELRGLRMIYVWVNDPDAKVGNSLDAWVPQEDGKGGLVRHYLIDFGSSLGAGGSGPPGAAWWYRYSWRGGQGRRGIDGYRRFASGLDATRLERRRREGDYLVAGARSSVNPFTYDFLWYNTPFSLMDDADAAWAARILLGFDEAKLRAALAAADWPKEVVDRVTERMLARRDSVVAAIFHRASPFGLPWVLGSAVCARDLHARRQVCAQAPAADGYHVVRLRPAGAPDGRDMRVHVLRGDREVRILGVERE